MAEILSLHTSVVTSVLYVLDKNLNFKKKNFYLVDKETFLIFI